MGEAGFSNLYWLGIVLFAIVLGMEIARGPQTSWVYVVGGGLALALLLLERLLARRPSLNAERRPPDDS